FCNFCVTVSTTSAPAEFANSRNSSSESCNSHFETPSFSRPISSARSRDFCGCVSIILCANLRQHSERDPFHSFVASKKRQVQRWKISLPPKPGQLSLRITASRLLNLCNTLWERLFSSEQFSDFAQTDH